ncbi:MAG TPA: PEGA domain-containing protein [Polyangiaceae bacterium]|jgi:hypothetical protein
MPRPLAVITPLLLGLLLGARPAHSQLSAEDSERANALFKKGKLAYTDGHLQDALRLYGEAWQLKQSPDIAANLAQTEAELHMPRAAADHFAFALEHLLPSSTEEQKSALNQGLELEKKEIGTLHITLEPADAAIAIDGVATSLHPSGDLYVEPGEHRCAVTREGYQASTQTVKVSKGGSQVLWVKLNPSGGAAGAAPATSGESANAAGTTAATDATGADSAPGRRSLVPAYIGGGIAVVGVAAGFVFLASRSSHADKSRSISAQIPGESGCGTGTAFATQCDQLHSENDSAHSARSLEFVSFGVGAAATVGTIVYLLWPKPSAGAGSALHVYPGVGSLTLAGGF